MSKKIVHKAERFNLRRLSRVFRQPKQAVTAAEANLLEPYDWGAAGEPKGKSLKYVAGRGWIIGD